jgi:hypothetical protein
MIIGKIRPQWAPHARDFNAKNGATTETNFYNDAKIYKSTDQNSQ